ncbi:MAG TPA: SDR family oxidoreductase [Pseudonocardia sp.]|jgi:NAD(P)-dependent dehydrogenase (short-subunit alcohol dehydrogenase family)
MRNVNGKVAVVTGGGSGIGRVIVLELAKLGASVAVADINLDNAKKVAQEAGPKATAHHVDVSSAEQFIALREEVLAAHGVVDILVNNAGVGTAPCQFVEAKLEDVRRIIDINLWGAINGSHAFLPQLMKRPEASLVNIGSYTGMLGTMTMVGYSTSKFAVRGFTEALRMELVPSPVTVTLVMPGVTRTALMENSPLVSGKQKEDLAKAFANAPAVGPEVVAAGVLKGIRGKKPLVLTGKDTKMLDKIVRLAPGRYSQLMYKPLKKSLDKTVG